MRWGRDITCPHCHCTRTGAGISIARRTTCFDLDRVVLAIRLRQRCRHDC